MNTFMELATSYIIPFAVMFVMGCAVGFLLFRHYQRRLIWDAQSEAQELLQEVQDEVELVKIEQQEKKQEIELDLWTKAEAELLRLEERNEDLQTAVDEKKKKMDDKHSVIRGQLKEHELKIREQEKAISQAQTQWNQKQQNFVQFQTQIRERILEKFPLDVAALKAEIQSNLEQETRRRGERHLEWLDEDLKDNADTYAKRILDIALDRFARPYCAERGIGAVSFPDPQARQAFDKPEILQAIQKSCGCDIIIEADQPNVGVAGFDPVRRELTRRVLEKLMKNRRDLNPGGIERLAEQEKRNLFRQIQQDGEAIARELRVPDLHPEVKQMMGSLRYRYSFTQNQYFHCGEVGWLAGLLASELQAEVKKARRSGLLHDIGKSMDHAMDGGHAMIGADFIEKRGEAADVVHNVRAHHFDVTPSSDEAFLVIAADAISGARPGARRSTMESYTQKVTELQDIARSFDGVTDCFVLNGGRECRVIVNSRKVSDAMALDYSRQMAQRIENECSYPGSIKVVVVRETSTSEVTK
ncbi:MAG: Rnase Y domain-containing protein [Bdellovibrionales bacterium]